MLVPIFWRGFEKTLVALFCILVTNCTNPKNPSHDSSKILGENPSKNEPHIVINIPPASRTLGQRCSKIGIELNKPGLSGGIKISCDTNQSNNTLILDISPEPRSNGLDELHWRLRSNSQNEILEEGSFSMINKKILVSSKLWKNKAYKKLVNLMVSEFTIVRDNVLGSRTTCEINPCASNITLAKISILSVVSTALLYQEANEALVNNSSDQFFSYARGSAQSFVAAIMSTRNLIGQICQNRSVN